MEQIHFSIIIPCFNSASTIKRTLESILTQDYDLKKIQLLIIDDCSTDLTLEVIQSFSGLKKFGIVNVSKTETNLGPGVARNLGIEDSIGRYILFIDSDDTLNHLSLKELYNFSLNGADIILFDGQLMAKKPSLICKHLKMSNASRIIKAKTVLNLESNEHVIFSAYRRDFLCKLPRFVAGFYEDVEFAGWSYFKAQRVEHLSSVLVNKFYTPGQITGNMTLVKAKQYVSARLRLSTKIIESLPDQSEELKIFFESGIRGSIAVTLKKLRKNSQNLEQFNFYLREFFEFICGEVDNLESIVLNHNYTTKDIETLNFYSDWKKIFYE